MRKGEKGMRENGKRGTVDGEVLDPVVKWIGGDRRKEGGFQLYRGGWNEGFKIFLLFLHLL